MDTIRKRPAMPHEQCDKTPETNLVAQRDLPARPLGPLFPLDASAPDILKKPSPDVARALTSTPSPLFRRVAPKPRRLAAPASAGTPDWSLSAGAAVVLLGFAVAFGTYVTLTERDAIQSRLRLIVSQNELRAASHHDRSTIAERTQELTRILREQIEALRSLDVADAAAIAGTAAIPPANAHSSTLASSAPSLPSRPAPPPAPNRTPPSQTAAKPLAPPVPQPAPRAHQAASTEPTRARVVATAPHDQTTSVKPANSVCGARSPCVETTATSSRKPVKTPATVPQQDVKPRTATVRTAAAKAPAGAAPNTAPATVQAYVQPDVGPAARSVSDSRLIYRQH